MRKPDEFNAECVNVDEIEDNRTYYYGFTFIPSIESSVCVLGHIKATADAAHCQGHVVKSYGTIFQILVYDTNLHVVSFVFHHSVGTECMDLWKKVFEIASSVVRFNVLGHVTNLDQGKYRRSVHRIMEHAVLLLEMLHVSKMAPKLELKKQNGLQLFEKTVGAFALVEVEAMKQLYGLKKWD